jgi:FkbM family methyltransferase
LSQAPSSPSLVKRVLGHARQGTLLARTREHWQAYRAISRSKWWDSRRGREGFCNHWLEPSVRLRLYFDSELCRFIYQGDFETNERAYLHAFLRPGDVFVDVGANIGLFTLIAARIVGESGAVHAFEPCAKTYRRLLDNVAMNKLNNVECHQAALSDIAQTLEMSISTDGMDAWNALADRPYMGQHYEKESIQACRWDDVASERNLIGRVALMKIDVEGWETHVLNGALKSLSHDDAPVLQVEFTDSAARAAGDSCQNLYRTLESLGYRMYQYDAGSRVLHPDPMRQEYGYLNLFAVKDLAAAKARLEARD